ncbi:MAG: hypothetical protein WKF30_17685 [Pyrinomonadaceae bacterium]
MEQLTESGNDELARRHRAAAMTVAACFALTVLLVALVVAGVRIALPPAIFDPTLATALWIGILLFGLGAVALRRTKFSTMRLQDIAGVRGESALLATLQKTTMLVALLGAGIAVMGFIITMITADRTSMLRAAPIAVAVLFYAYPRRAAWQRMVGDIESPNGEAPAAKGRIA